MTDHSRIDEDGLALSLLIRGFQVSRMIRLVADLGIADKVPPEGRRNVRDLAADCGVLSEPLLRVLRALAAFEIFRVTADGDIAHSPRSLLLRTGVPNSYHHAARFFTTQGSWSAWGALDAALVGGVPHKAAWHTDRFQYLREHPEEARKFDAYMAHAPSNRHGAVAAAYDFGGAALIADIGGGNGEALRRILTRFPSPRGLVYDREDVVHAIAPSQRLGGRIDVEAGSFFDRIPEGADVYLLILVLHDWPDDDCVRILRNCRVAMSSTARLLIVEQVLEADPAVGHPLAYLSDVQMMAMFGSARERTPAEFEELLGASNLTSLRLLPTASAVSILEVARG